MTFRVQLCGGPALLLGAVPVEMALKRRHAELALAFLVLERGRAVPADEVADVLWPDDLPMSWAASLRRVLSLVRGAFVAAGLSPDEVLTVAFGCYQLHVPSGMVVDVEEAAANVAAAEVALRADDADSAARSAERAAATLSETFLPAAVGPWVDRRRNALDALRVRAFEVAAEGHAAAGRPDDAASAAGRALTLDPFRESSHRLLLAAHAAAGRRAAAVRAHEAFRQVLADEVGVETSPELEAEYRALINGAGRGPRTIAQGPLIGRRAELDTLAAAWRSAATGVRAVAVRGWPGQGKTSLLDHFADHVRGQRGVVLEASCSPAMAMPYQPLVQAIERLLDELPPADLTRLVDGAPHELRRVLSVSGDHDAGGVVPEDVDVARFRLYEGMARVIAEVAAGARTLVIVDDAHWATPGTVGALMHLVRSLANQPVLVVVAIRPPDAAANDAVVDLFEFLRKHAGLVEIELDGLDVDDVGMLVEQMLGHCPAELSDIAAGLHRRAAGNPLFTIELLDGLRGAAVTADMAAAAPMPGSAKAAFERRRRALPATANQLLDAGAVLGFEWRLGDAAEVAGLADREVIAAAREVLQSGLVVAADDDGDRIVFRHALAHEAVLADLDGPRTVHLHRRAGDVLVRRSASAKRVDVSAIAAHFVAAARLNPGAAARWAIAAGEQALAVGARREALHWFAEAEPALADAAPDIALEARLLIGRGDGERQVGDPAYRETLQRAAALADRLGDGDLLARAALAGFRGITGEVDRVNEDRLALIRRALEVLGPTDDPRRARLLAVLATEALFADDYPTRRAVADEALDVARRLGDPRTLLQVLVNRHNPIWVPETLAERVEQTAEAMALAAELGDSVSLFWVAGFAADAAMETGDLPAVDHHIALQEELADRLAQPLMQWDATFTRAWRDLFAGKTDEAEQSINRAIELAASAGQTDTLLFHGTQLLAVRHAQGRLHELVDVVEAIAVDNPLQPSLRAALALTRLAAGDRAGAADLVRLELASGFEHPKNFLWATAMALWADAAADVRDLRAAEVLLERLSPWRDQYLLCGAFAWGSVADLVGRLEATLGAVDAADRSFAAALDAHQRLGAPFHEARTALAWAESITRRPDATPDRVAQARVLLDGAQAIAEEGGYLSIAEGARAVRDVLSSAAGL